jgi:hypothetical protein
MKIMRMQYAHRIQAFRAINLMAWYSCKRKKRFETQKDANDFGLYYNQKSYECRRCGGWHLTSDKRKFFEKYQEAAKEETR